MLKKKKWIYHKTQTKKKKGTFLMNLFWIWTCWTIFSNEFDCSRKKLTQHVNWITLFSMQKWILQNKECERFGGEGQGGGRYKKIFVSFEGTMQTSFCWKVGKMEKKKVVACVVVEILKSFPIIQFVVFLKLNH